MFEFSQMEYAIMLIGIAIEVFKTSRGDDATTIWNLLKRFRGMNDERKRVAHGLWVPFKDGGTVLYTSRSKLTPANFEGQAEHLEKLSDQLCQLRADFEREASYSGLQF
jgi:hypothetical protein